MVLLTIYDTASPLRTSPGVRRSLQDIQNRGRWRPKKPVERRVKTYWLVKAKSQLPAELLAQGAHIAADPARLFRNAILQGPGRRTQPGRTLVALLGGEKFSKEGEDAFQQWPPRSQRLAGDLSSRTVPGLKSWAKGLGLKRSGKKADLTQRIKENSSASSGAETQWLSDSEGRMVSADDTYGSHPDSA